MQSDDIPLGETISVDGAGSAADRVVGEMPRADCASATMACPACITGALAVSPIPEGACRENLVDALLSEWLP